MSWLEPTNLLLLACALLYGLMGEWMDAAILLVFVLGISLLDAVQQQRSSHALAELARLSAPRARGRRDGKDLELATDQVRLGDLLRLEEGDRVAADAAITEAVGLWLLLMATPGLQRLLSLASLQASQIVTVLITTAVALLLAAVADRCRLRPPISKPANHSETP